MNIEAFDLIDTAHFGTLQDFIKKYKKEDINKQNKYGYSCLHRAIGGHHWDTVNFLLDEGIDIRQEWQESNLHLRFWRPLCYHYTTLLYI